MIVFMIRQRWLLVRGMRNCKEWMCIITHIPPKGVLFMNKPKPEQGNSALW